MNRIAVVALLASCVLLGGCYPVIGLARHGIRGQLVNDVTGEPIAGATVLLKGWDNNETRLFEMGKVTSGKDGRFRKRPAHDIYMTWFMCGPVYVLFMPQKMVMTISTADGRSRSFDAIYARRPPDNIPPNALQPTQTDGYLDFGEIRMKGP